MYRFDVDRAVHPARVTDIDIRTHEHPPFTPCIPFTTLLPQFTPVRP
jgi:hypothetical protein